MYVGRGSWDCSSLTTHFLTTVGDCMIGHAASLQSYNFYVSKVVGDIRIGLRPHQYPTTLRDCDGRRSEEVV